MLTSNTELLRRLEVLNKQYYDCQAEIELRITQGRPDNDGYVIVKEKDGYGLVSKDFYLQSMQQLVNEANAKLKDCKE